MFQAIKFAPGFLVLNFALPSLISIVGLKARKAGKLLCKNFRFNCCETVLAAMAVAIIFICL